MLQIDEQPYQVAQVRRNKTHQAPGIKQLWRGVRTRTNAKKNPETNHPHKNKNTQHDADSRWLTLRVCVPSSISWCSTIMSRFSAGFSAEAGLARATLAPLAMRRSSRSTGAEGDWSFADSDAFKRTVDGR